MAYTARYAWWLLIILFSLIIVANALLFVNLFYNSPQKGFRNTSPDLATQFQLRYVLMLSQLGVDKQTVNLAVGQLLESLNEQMSQSSLWETVLEKAIVEALFGQGNLKATLAQLPEAPSEQFTPTERRWYSALWQSILTQPLPSSEVPRWVESLRPTVSPLLMRLVEAHLYERAGDRQRAEAIRSELASSALPRMLLLGMLMILAGGLLFVGLGVLGFYPVLAKWSPLPKRPYDQASPFALDPLLWSLVAFLLLVVSGAGGVLNDLLSALGVEVPSPYLLTQLTAVAISLGILYSLNHWLEGVGSVQWFSSGSTIRQVGASLAGYSAFIPLAVLSLCCLILANPALPSEQMNPILEEPPGSALDFFIVFFMAVVLAPIVEEFLFRGVLFQVLWQRTGRVWLSAVVSGFLFAIIHPQFLAGIGPVFLLGVILAIVYAHTRSLLPCILLHAYNNGFITLLFWSVLG